jgi:drug/metabolite transporter (DMT)-like permease
VTDRGRRSGQEGGGERSAWGLLALGMIVFGSATPVSKIVGAGLPPFVGAALRVSLGAAVLAPFAWRRRAALRAMGRPDWLRTAAIALVGMCAFTVLMLYGMRLVSGVVGAIVMSTTPALTAVCAVLLLGERATWRKGTAAGLAVVGVVVLHAGGAVEAAGGEALLGVALVLGAVLCEVGYTLLGKRMTERVDPLVVAFLAAAMAVPAFAPLAAWQARDLALDAVTPRVWVALAWYGAGTLALGSWAWYAGLARAEAGVAAGFMGLMPVSALVLSYVLLDQPFRWVHLLGFATVFAGVLLVSHEHARSGR